MRPLLLAALLALSVASACGAYRFGPPSPEPATVSGFVTLSPCRPVVRPGDPPCPPAPGVSVDFVPGGGGSTVSATTDSGGAYSVTLAPGTYEARLKRGLDRSGRRFTVAAGQHLTLDLTFDSGIR